METKKCKKCQKIIAGDIYRISTTEYEARSWKKKGEKYKSYCQPCYEKLPIGVRPYDCKGNDKCQSCGATKECGAKKCNNSSCVDRISRICGDCWSKEWKKCIGCRQEKELELDGNRLCNDCRVSNKKKWDGLLNCNVCSRRVKTLFTSSGQAGGDMCANCYARTCEKCGASMRGFEVCWKCITSRSVSANPSISCSECKKSILAGEEYYTDFLNSYGSPYNICYCKPCGDKKKEEWEKPLEKNECSKCGIRGSDLGLTIGSGGCCPGCSQRDFHESIMANIRNKEEYREFTNWLDKNNIPNKVAESKIENLNLSLKGKKTKKPFLICQHCNSDIPLWKYHNEVNYKNDIDAEIAICHAKHVRDCSSAPFLARSKANAALDKKNYDGFYFTESGSRGQGNRNQENGNPNGNQKGNDGLVKGILIVGLLSSLIALGIYALWRKKRRRG